MATFPFRDTEIPLVLGIDDLDVGDAEVLEVDLGIDLRDTLRQPLSKMAKAFALISVRRVFPDVAVDDVDLKRIKLGPLLAAITAAGEQAKEQLAAEGVPAAEAERIAEQAPGVVLSPTSAGSSA